MQTIAASFLTLSARGVFIITILILSHAVSGAQIVQGQLNWKLQTDFNPLNNTEEISVSSSYSIPRSGGIIVIRAACIDSSLSLSFSSFDADNKPLPYEVSGDGPSVQARVKYDDDAVQPYRMRLAGYSNKLSITIAGRALYSFDDADSVMLELPLSDGRKAFPLIRPHDQVFGKIVKSCIAALKQDEQREVDQKTHENEKRKREQEQFEARCTAIYDCQKDCRRTYGSFNNASGSCLVQCGTPNYRCPHPKFN